MQVIPVIDLKGGRAVHARRGDRAQYKPLDVPGCRDGNPLAAVDAYRAIYPFTTMYAADLDAIGGSNDSDEVLLAIKHHCPGLSLLVDNGTASESAARSWIGRGLGALVVGSETMPPKALARDLKCPLSLDFRAEGFQGPPGLDTEVQFWPETLIVMTLARVGSGEGPDLERLAAIRERAGERRIIAAGGVRNARDLHALADLGIDGVLAATCLHNGSVTAADIAALNP